MNFTRNLNKLVTCISCIFGCLLLKCDTGLSLETRNSLMICNKQYMYYSHILRVIISAHKTMAWKPLQIKTAVPL